uniref:Uncharacterized protein n=1 Tax=Sphaerodactylus townsendi TaxID=933632 RepID=A0ACB8GG69_9SAUR
MSCVTRAFPEKRDTKSKDFLFSGNLQILLLIPGSLLASLLSPLPLSFSGALNNFFGKAGKYQVSAESTSSSSENTSKAYSLLT